MIPAQRNYREYNLDNILDMGYEAFEELLNNEVYSLVLVYRLLELMSNFKDIEEYMFCHHIQSWFDKHNINLDNAE